MNSGWKKDYLRYKAFFAHMVTQYRERASVKVYLEILLSLTTISIFVLFALRPTVLTIAQLLKDIESKKQTIIILDQKIESLATAQAVYDQNRSKIAILESAIPKSSEADVFARQIEGLVGGHTIDLVSLAIDKGAIVGGISLAPVKPLLGRKKELPENASSLEFSMTLSTDIDNFPSLERFVSDFEKLRRPAIIDELRITRGQEKDNTKIVLFLRGRVPYLIYNRVLEVN